jgi:hypothetical protein
LAEFTPIGKNFTLPLREDPPSESPSRPHILLHESSKIPIQYSLSKAVVLVLPRLGSGQVERGVYFIES